MFVAQAQTAGRVGAPATEVTIREPDRAALDEASAVPQLLAVREVVEQPALAGPTAPPDIVERDRADAA